MQPARFEGSSSSSFREREQTRHFRLAHLPGIIKNAASKWDVGNPEFAWKTQPLIENVTALTKRAQFFELFGRHDPLSLPRGSCIIKIIGRTKLFERAVEVFSASSGKRVVAGSTDSSSRGLAFFPGCGSGHP
jgi:hypothetical protein